MFLAKFSALCFFIVQSKAVPPEECFANFRWDDCGQSPEPVIYYWKPGSRCEVGTWRGCLPNPNMFKNEYECIKTCIFDNDLLLQEPVENQTGLVKAAESGGSGNYTKIKRSSDIEKEPSKEEEVHDKMSTNETASDETPLHNDVRTNRFEETLPSNVTAAADETLSNVTMVPDDSLQSTVTVERETLAPNVDDEAFKDSLVHDESAKSSDTSISDDKLASNQSLVANETNTNNKMVADDTPGSNDALVSDDPAGSNKTPIQGDEADEQEKDNDKPDETPTQAPRDKAANKQEKDDGKPDEEKKPVGRSRLASFLKGK